MPTPKKRAARKAASPAADQNAVPPLEPTAPSPYSKAAEFEANLPPGTIRVTTYAAFRDIVSKWASGKLDDSVIVIGPAGVGKSEQARAALKGVEHCYLKGSATKYGVYLSLIAHQNEPVVLDDVDTLLRSAEVTGLLKMLLETTSPKLVQWTTANTVLGDDVPASFSTTSRTMILANELSQVSKNFSAVLERCTIVYFSPTVEEISAYAKSWFKGDPDVYAYVTERLPAAPAPSCRYYYHAQKWKNADFDWKALLDTMMTPAEQDATLVKALEIRYTSAADRVKAWTKETGKSAQSYWTVKRFLDLRVGKKSKRGEAIAAGMRRAHAAKKAGVHQTTRPDRHSKDKAAKV